MSYWTYIQAMVEIDLMDVFMPELCKDEGPMLSQEDIDKKAQEIYEGLPKITGSEYPADVFMNRGSWVGMSCDKLPLTDPIEYVDYRFKYFFTIWGALRDRRKPDTEKEYNALLDYLKEKVGVENVGELSDITED